MHSPQLEQSIPFIALETKHGDILQLKAARQAITYYAHANNDGIAKMGIVVLQRILQWK